MVARVVVDCLGMSDCLVVVIYSLCFLEMHYLLNKT